MCLHTAIRMCSNGPYLQKVCHCMLGRCRHKPHGFSSAQNQHHDLLQNRTEECGWTPQRRRAAEDPKEAHGARTYISSNTCDVLSVSSGLLATTVGSEQAARDRHTSRSYLFVMPVQHRTLTYLQILFRHRRRQVRKVQVRGVFNRVRCDCRRIPDSTNRFREPILATYVVLRRGRV